MPAQYKLTYSSPAGLLLIPNLVFSSLSYVRRENDVGEMNIKIPPLVDVKKFTKDGRLDLYRSVNEGPFYLEGGTSFLVNRIRMAQTDNGEEEINISSSDMLLLAKRRKVAYDAGSSYTDKLGMADDLMKGVIRENYGALAIDTNRDISSYLQVDADVGAGPIISDEISWKPVMDVLKGFAAASEEAGIRLLFDIVKSSTNTYIFKTYKNYRGVDHSSTSGKPVILSQPLGNLTSPEVIVDWTDEYNYVYAAGRGNNAWRPIQEVYDAQRVNQSPFSRTELFINESNIADPDKLINAGNRALQLYRPRILFSGRALDTPGLIYGIHYNYGDLVTAIHKGIRFNCRVNMVKIDLSNEGEKLDIRMQGEFYA